MEETSTKKAMFKRNIPRKGIEDLHKQIAQTLNERPRRTWIGPYPEDYEPSTEEFNDPKNWKSSGSTDYSALMEHCLRDIRMELKLMLKSCDCHIDFDEYGYAELCDCPIYEDYKDDLGAARLGEEEAD